MDITIKCPNCYQQVSRENRFCIFCGYDLSDVESHSTDEVIPVDYKPIDSAMPYDGPRYCPKGHDVADPSLGFCSTCGSPLVNEPATERKDDSRPVSVVTRRYTSRTCKCGYVCDDPDLSFCPACGLPLDTTVSSEVPGWKCVCGANNSADFAFCEDCGKPKGWCPPEPPPAHKDVVADIPSGMVPLSELDLTVKSKYGN